MDTVYNERHPKPPTPKLPTPPPGPPKEPTPPGEPSSESVHNERMSTSSSQRSKCAGIHILLYGFIQQKKC